MELKDILEHAMDEQASDVFIVAGLPLTYKVKGRLSRSEGDMLVPQDTAALVEQIYSLSGRKHYDTECEPVDDDFSFGVAHLGRFRANIFKQRGSLAAILRVISFQMPDPTELSITPRVLSCADFKKGIVLVTGPAGSGKSTTLACLIDRINKTRESHIITMEDPVEFIHRHDRSIVTQREIPNDTRSYEVALRAALRESPDVILLGEMRDLTTIETAMTAAETGQLLFSTLHTVGAANTIDRIIDVFPANQQQQIRMQLSMVLQAVVSQQLVPSVSGGLVPAFEVMFVNPAIRNLIREAKTYQIDSAIQAASADGMTTMDASLIALYKGGVISKETVLTHCVYFEATEKRIAALG